MRIGDTDILAILSFFRKNQHQTLCTPWDQRALGKKNSVFWQASTKLLCWLHHQSCSAYNWDVIYSCCISICCCAAFQVLTDCQNQLSVPQRFSCCNWQYVANSSSDEILFWISKCMYWCGSTSYHDQYNEIVTTNDFSHSLLKGRWNTGVHNTKTF